MVSGVTLPLALAKLKLIDEYEFVILPRLSGQGPSVLNGQSEIVDLSIVSQQLIDENTIALKYIPRYLA